MSYNRYKEKLESDEGLGMVNHDKDSFASRVVGAERKAYMQRIFRYRGVCRELSSICVLKN